MPFNDTDPQEFFSRSQNHSEAIQPPVLCDPEPLSPIYVQTSSQATTPPLSHIVKYSGICDRMHAYGDRRRGSRCSNDFHRGSLANTEWTIEPANKGNGGLRNAVRAAHDNGSLQDRTWVGTLGMPTDLLEDTPQKINIEDKLGTEFDSLVVFVKDGDFNGHYSHYCKQVCSGSSPGSILNRYTKLCP
jgi:trehalose 6-phosphate synthase complex regulatory subunit